MKFNLDIPLNPKQVDMYNSLMSGMYDEALFYGTSRSGKTFLILFFLIVQTLTRGANCLVVRNTFTSLQSGMIQQTLPAVLNAIAKHNGFSSYTRIVLRGNPFCRYDAKNCVLRFFNDNYIQFSSMRGGAADSNSSFDKILSTEWGHIFFDEVSEVDAKPIDILRTRLAQKLGGQPNILITALNPTTKLHWTYKRYFKHKDTDGAPIEKKDYSRYLVMHFGKDDNVDYVSHDYFSRTLGKLSRLQQMRFLDGEYVDEGEGEIFKKITWGDVPPISKIEDCIIYCDPSAADSKTSDFKASVLLARASNKIYLIDVRAVQGTSRQMLDGIYDLYLKSPIVPRIYMEKRQVPQDFAVTFERFQEDKGWVCPLIWDTRNMGDKFTCIESTLDPLFQTEQFLFCPDIKDSGVYEQTIDQFLRFARGSSSTRKDDIPDACAKGTTLLNRGLVYSQMEDEVLIVKRGSASSQISKNPKYANIIKDILAS